MQFSLSQVTVHNQLLVPTLKVVTTTQRYEMLERDMDINAGAYRMAFP